MKIDPQQIVLVDPALLTVHPVARDLPELADDDPDFLALGDNIREFGILYPIDIDPQNQVLDGRHRWRWANRLKLPTIPAVIRRGAEAVKITLESLLLRRHYTKGALAFSAYPLLRQAYEEAVANRAPHSVRHPFTVEVQAEKFGISTRLYQQAGELHTLFSKAPEYAEEMIPKILSGDVGLGAAIAGYAGRENTKGKPKPKVNTLKLFSRTWTDLTSRFDYWNKFQPEQKREACQAIDKAVASMPEDLLKNFHGRLGSEIKSRKQEAK